MFLLSWTDVMVALANGVAGVALAAPAFLALNVPEKHLGSLFSFVGVLVFLGSILVTAARNVPTGSIKRGLGGRYRGFAECCDLFIRNSLRHAFWADIDLSGGKVPVEVCRFATYLAERGFAVDLSSLVSYLAGRRNEILRHSRLPERRGRSSGRPLRTRVAASGSRRAVGHSA